MFFDKIKPVYFFIAFALGLLFCYISKPKPTVVIKFPSPLNSDQITYKHDDGSCYKIKANKETCPLDKDLIRPQPLA
jgi:hypothetical protein